jgi:hypothetical protein
MTGEWKGSRSEGCRGVEHGQTCTEDCTDVVAVRAALESSVELGRGEEVNRQAEMANPRNEGIRYEKRTRWNTTCPGDLPNMPPSGTLCHRML